jgi:hypothetical protein
MSDQTCVVYETYRKLSELIDSGRLTHPRLRRQAEDLLKLVKDISTGGAGPQHLPAMLKGMALIAAEETEASSREVVRILRDALDSHKEVFASHIETHNCPTGDCDILTPAPCQMACPAGIDVSSYVSLIGEGRYAEAVELIRKDNPFPWVCGLICTHPCEFVCVRGKDRLPHCHHEFEGLCRGEGRLGKDL